VKSKVKHVCYKFVTNSLCGTGITDTMSTVKLEYMLLLSACWCYVWVSGRTSLLVHLCFGNIFKCYFEWEKAVDAIERQPQIFCYCL